jgi:hypothetical protein
VVAWYWESVNPNPTLTFPTQLNSTQLNSTQLNSTQLNAAVPWDSSRLQAEEDVNYHLPDLSPASGITHVWVVV